MPGYASLARAHRPRSAIDTDRTLRSLGEGVHRRPVGPTRSRQDAGDHRRGGGRYDVRRPHGSGWNRGRGASASPSSPRQGHSPGAFLGFHSGNPHGKKTTRPVPRVCRNGPGRQHAERPANQLRATSRESSQGQRSPSRQQFENIGAPPFDTMEKAARYFDVLGTYESDRGALSSLGPLMFVAPRLSLWDMYSRYRGFAAIPPWRLYQETFATDLPSLGVDFRIPVYFFQGADDDVTCARC
jgi:hypothetical protein